jgi:cytochrome c-type biogenesis protein CcmH/NrfG
MAGSILNDIQTKHAKELRLRELERELAFTPDKPDLHAEMAGIYLDDKKFPEAEAAIQKAISLDPRKLDYLLLSSKILDQQGKKAEAAGRLEEAVRLDPKDYKNILSLAGMYFQSGKLPEAKEKLNEVISLAPQSEEAKFARTKLTELENLKTQGEK